MLIQNALLYVEDDKLGYFLASESVLLHKNRQTTALANKPASIFNTLTLLNNKFQSLFSVCYDTVQHISSANV